MNSNVRKVILSVLAVGIGLCLALEVSQAFVRPQISEPAETEVSINTCAKITLLENGTKINLANTASMSDNKGLQTTPYEFTIKNACTETTGYRMYLATFNANTLDAQYIKYAIKDKTTGETIIMDNLGEQAKANSDFNQNEITQITTGIGTPKNIYVIMENFIMAKSQKSYQLYIWVDEEAGNEAMNQKTFTAGVLAKGFDSINSATFSLQNTSLVNYLKSTVQDDNYFYWHNEELVGGAEDESYRYAGPNENVNNYICFGSDEEICPENNLYRIIGIFNNQVKLIKADYASPEELGSNGEYSYPYSQTSWGSAFYKGKKGLDNVGTVFWNHQEENNSTNTWENSQLNTINLNTNFYNTLQDWQSKIVTTNWQVDGFTTQEANAKTVIEEEIKGSTNTTSSKIGLMYASDYYYAASPNYWDKLGYSGDDTEQDYRSAAADNWLYMGLYEWLLAPKKGTTNKAYHLNHAGYIDSHNVNENSVAVRPVFYLNQNVGYAGGTGSLTEPYRIR
ncbi:MAG: hypothetical protein K2M17_01835 [Bacilli bacterium]|nr:hypothetical protein [Bacilli bacterium]